MTPERWRQVTELFHPARSRDASARAGYLDGTCAGDRALRDEVEAMLTAHQDTGSFGDRPGSRSIDAVQRLETGTRLGPYRVERLIGAGGMGEVYRARDTKLGPESPLRRQAGPIRSSLPLRLYDPPRWHSCPAIIVARRLNAKLTFETSHG